MYNFISHSEEETKNIAYKLAKELHTGDIVVLSGDLGSGKTKFTEGFLSFWELGGEVSSPTFTIVNEYKKDDANIYHFDLYRLNSHEEFNAIGGAEYFMQGICIIEWGELIQNILPFNHIKITFSKDMNNEHIRHLEFTSPNKDLKAIIRHILL